MYNCLTCLNKCILGQLQLVTEQSQNASVDIHKRWERLRLFQIYGPCAVIIIVVAVIIVVVVVIDIQRLIHLGTRSNPCKWQDRVCDTTINLIRVCKIALFDGRVRFALQFVSI